MVGIRSRAETRPPSTPPGAIEPAVIDKGASAFARVIELEVYHPGNRVRAILRRCPVAQHFNATERGSRDLVDVNRSAAAPDRSVEVQQRGDMATLSVDQHQHLVRAKTAQSGRADRVGAVGDRRLREVQQRHQIAQQARGLGEA